MAGRFALLLASLVLVSGLPVTAPAQAEDRSQLRATIAAARADNQRTAKILAALPADDARLVREQLNSLRASANKASADLSKSRGAPSRSLTARILTLGREASALREGADADRSALMVLDSVRARSLAELRTGLAKGFNPQWNQVQLRWSRVGAHALRDRATAHAAVRRLTPLSRKPDAAQALRIAEQGRMPAAVPGLAPIPGGCALPSAAESDYLPSVAAARPLLWTSPRGLAHHRAQLASPTELLSQANSAAIRQATTYAREAGRPGTPSQLTRRVLAVGYAWLTTADSLFRDALILDLGLLSTAEPAEPVEEAKWALILATAVDWLGDDPVAAAAVERAKHVLEIRSLGTLGCSLALGETISTDKLNKSVVIGSGTVLASLALSREEPWRSGLAATIRAALAGAHDGLAALDVDGGSPEGPGYWNFQSVPAAALLSSIEETVSASVLRGVPPLRKAGTYALNTSAPGANREQESTRYSDTKDTALRCTLPAWIAGRYADPDAITVALEGQLRQGVELLWWPDSEVGAERTGGVFAGSGLAVIRSGEATAWLLGQPAKTNHTQLDAGAVTIRVNGVDWSLDAGYGIEGPGYSEDRPDGRRWTYPQTQPAWHSTVRTMRTSRDVGQVVGAQASLTATSTTASVDLTEVLAGAKRARRSAELGPGSLTLMDEIQGSRQTYAWSWVTQAQVQVSGSSVQLSQGSERALLEFVDLPAGAVISTTSVPAALGQEGRRIQVVLPAAERVRMTVRLTW